MDTALKEDKLFTAKISRHLLFNSLNSAIVLCRRNSEEAAELINCLSHCLLYTSEEKEDLVPLADELSFIESYLHIQSVRFGKRLKLIFNTQDNIGFLPFLTLQPIVDNVFSHVMLHTREVVTLTIETKKEAKGAIVTVKDNRVGMELEELENFWHKNQGSSLDRLNSILIKNSLKELVIKSEKGKGTSVSVWTKAQPSGSDAFERIR